MKLSGQSEFFGMEVNEWISRVPNELSRAAVGLWQIIGAALDEFHYYGSELEECARQCIEGLVARGAVAVIGNSHPQYPWKKAHQFPTLEAIIEHVRKRYVEGGAEPDLGDIWFAVPENGILPDG